MIIVQLKGGLGNQLFQYAAGMAPGAHHGTSVKVDTAEVNKRDEAINTYRSFDLLALVNPPDIASEDELKRFHNRNPFTALSEKLLPPFKRSIYKEAGFYYDTHFLEAGNDIYLKGYRQSEKYFQSISANVRSAFRLKDEFISRVTSMAEQLRSQQSVAVHIRRGDYTNKIVTDYHGVLNADYYQQAIQNIESKVPGAKLYIFTDDPEWVKTNLDFSSDVEYISGNVTRSHFEDFYLISQCKHQVIANSTFSWWAAWLNPNPGKIVIAPKKWFNNAPYDTRDLIPADWIQL